MVNVKKANKSVVGDLINFRGLVYSPLNENGVNNSILKMGEKSGAAYKLKLKKS